jgi:hypothetical protein
VWGELAFFVTPATAFAGAFFCGFLLATAKEISPKHATFRRVVLNGNV